MIRRTGETSRQMSNAPRRAIFVWCNEYPVYARKLSKYLARTDLTISTPSRWEEEYRGRRCAVIFDHSLGMHDIPDMTCERIGGTVGDHGSTAS